MNHRDTDIHALPQPWHSERPLWPSDSDTRPMAALPCYHLDTRPGDNSGAPKALVHAAVNQRCLMAPQQDATPPAGQTPLASHSGLSMASSDA